MTKFIVAPTDGKSYELQADGLALEGSAAIFTNARIGKALHQRLIVPLVSVRWISEGASTEEGAATNPEGMGT